MAGRAAAVERLEALPPGLSGRPPGYLGQNETPSQVFAGISIQDRTFKRLGGIFNGPQHRGRQVGMRVRWTV